MSHNITPVFTTDSDPWAPSMPNSDLWTLRSARDAAELMSPKMRGNGPIPRRVVALRTSPLGRYPPLTPSTSVSPAALAPLQQPLSASQSDVLESPQPLQQSVSRTIGLGHPSTSKRRVVPLKSDSAMSSPQPSPRPCPRINSSTIKRRTERFPRRELHAIAEHPVTTQQGSTSSRPVHGPRRRSYAQAVSAKQTPKKITGRRVTPTTTLTLPPSPGSPRCATKQSGGTSVMSMTALAPRYTSSGAPQAGPMQVQSPRCLLPATMAGSPNFQSLDGAVMAITAAISDEKEEERGNDMIYGEDGFIKFKVHTQLQIRFAARRFKMLF